MSATIILSARPAKEKLEALLKEIQEMDLTPLEQMLTREETRQQHEARKRIIEERTMRLKLHISTLETINTNWIQYIQQVPATKRKQEEDKYAQMVEDKRVPSFSIRSLRIPSPMYNADKIISSKSLEKESKLGPINKYGGSEELGRTYMCIGQYM
uniref:Uncharacterized protein n=1 Tax=Wuchereria bancrofti TaxID=6293 RepID=A0AAF5RY42_WUCBA